MIIILIVKPFTHLVTTHGRMRGRNRQRKVKSLGNIVQKLRKNLLNCTSEYHSYWTFQTFFKCLLVILGNILHYRFKEESTPFTRSLRVCKYMITHAKFQKVQSIMWGCGKICKCLYCITTPDQRAFWKLITKNLVLSLVKHHLLKQLTAGKKHVSPSTPNPSGQKKNPVSLGKSYAALQTSCTAP